MAQQISGKRNTSIIWKKRIQLEETASEDGSAVGAVMVRLYLPITRCICGKKGRVQRWSRKACTSADGMVKRVSTKTNTSPIWNYTTKDQGRKRLEPSAGDVALLRPQLLVAKDDIRQQNALEGLSWPCIYGHKFHGVASLHGEGQWFHLEACALQREANG